MNIEIYKHKPLLFDKSENSRYEEFYFSAREECQEIGRLITTKVTEPIEDFERFYPNPVASFSKVEENFRGKGIAGQLLVKANEFTKREYNMPLVSGFDDSENMKRVWSKLEFKGLSKKLEFQGKEFWSMT